MALDQQWAIYDAAGGIAIALYYDVSPQGQGLRCDAIELHNNTPLTVSIRVLYQNNNRVMTVGPSSVTRVDLSSVAGNLRPRWDNQTENWTGISILPA
jgi:hypothetical protein